MFKPRKAQPTRVAVLKGQGIPHQGKSKVPQGESRFPTRETRNPHQGNSNTPQGEMRSTTRGTQNPHQGSKSASQRPYPAIPPITTPTKSPVKKHSHFRLVNPQIFLLIFCSLFCSATYQVAVVFPDPTVGGGAVECRVFPTLLSGVRLVAAPPPNLPVSSVPRLYCPRLSCPASAKTRRFPSPS